MPSASLGLRVRLGVTPSIGRRKYLLLPEVGLRVVDMACHSGYVALAVVSDDGVATREVETKSSDRAKNMLLFAEEALKLFLEVLKGDVALEGKPNL